MERVGDVFRFYLAKQLQIGEIRKELIKKYGTEIDKSWFKDMDYEENKERRTIKWRASSEFKQDWVKKRYLNDLVLAARTKNYELETIEC